MSDVAIIPINISHRTISLRQLHYNQFKYHVNLIPGQVYPYNIIGANTEQWSRSLYSLGVF